MKKILAFVISILVFNCSINSQEYISNKQRYLLGYDAEFTTIEQQKKVTIDGNNIVAELPNGQVFKSEIKYVSIKKNGLKEGKQYDAGSNTLVVYQDEIFLNIRGEIVTTYFLSNYELNPEQEKVLEEESKKIEYDNNVKVYGKLTADCIKNKKIEIGMVYNGVFDILGQPKSINTTKTANGLKQQFVYPNMNIYTEGNLVTAIQTHNE